MDEGDGDGDGERDGYSSLKYLKRKKKQKLQPNEVGKPVEREKRRWKPNQRIQNIKINNSKLCGYPLYITHTQLLSWNWN